jgi:LCP family protein required for cell wall assembly
MTKKIFLVIFISIGIPAIVLVLFLKYLSVNTGTGLFYFPQIFINVTKNPTLTSGFNFIILGLDPRNDSLENTRTTDTIIFANLSPDLKINLIPLPRDLWDYYLNTKINQIYPLSLERSDQFFYIQNQFQQLTGQKIDRTVVITTQNLIDLVNLIGGVDVYLDNGFKDDQYPNPAYISDPQSGAPKYITIEFPQGKVNLNQTNVTEFVRSRKSAATAALGGTDIGRIERQQQLIDALINKLKTINYLKHPQILFNLYNFFHSDLTTNITDSDLISLGLKHLKHFRNINLNKIFLTTGEDPKVDLVYHPQYFTDNQWVFLPQDKDYRLFQEFIRSSIQAVQ